MLTRLNYLKDIRGIGVFTARPGMGKSYTLRCFSSSLSSNLYQMEYFCLSTISVTEFYRQLCICLGVDTGGGKQLLENAAISAIHGYCHGNPRLIDNLMTDALTLGAQMDKKVIDADVILAAVNAQTLF